MVQLVPVGDQWALVDDEDYPSVSLVKWYLSSYGYATNPAITSRAMHRFIMGSTSGDGLAYDHINHNRLDNRRCNLRLATPSQNRANQKQVLNGSSRFKGVRKGLKGWQARCAHKHLGTWEYEEDAARAYNKAAWERWGEYARLNPVEGDPVGAQYKHGDHLRRDLCKRGHEFAGKSKAGRNYCRICAAMAARRYRQREQEQAGE